MTARLSVILLAGIGVFAACEPIIGIDFDAAREKASVSCELKKPKSRPATADSESTASITVVTYNSNFGDQQEVSGEPGYLSIGYDLDDTCTGRGDPSPCVVPAWIQSDAKDGPNGQDNGAGRIVQGQGSEFNSFFLNSEVIALGETSGKYAPMAILRVTEYNATPYDPNVTVEWIVPLPPKSAAEPFTPSFDGKDRWPIHKAYVEEDASAEGGVRSKLIDTTAYVANFQLVARFKTAVWPLFNFYNEVDEVIVTGTITPDENDAAGRVIRDITVGAKVSIGNMFRATPYLMKQTLNLVPCTNSQIYPNFKRFICNGVDLKLGGSGSTCNAVSCGVNFKAATVTLGAVEDWQTPEPLCAPEFDPQYDSCDTPEPKLRAP